MDLYQSDIIRDSAAQWHDNLRAMSEREGKLFGYPVFVDGQALRVDERIGHALDALPATDVSWSLFYDHLNDLHLPSPGYLARANLHKGIVLEEFLDRVVHGGGDRTMDELIVEMLHAQSANSDAVCFTEDGRTIENTAALYKLDYFEPSSTFLPMPSLAGKATVPVSINWLVVNPYSDKVAQAIQYVEAYSRAMDMGLIYSIVLGKNQVFPDEIDEAYVQQHDELLPYYKVRWGVDFGLFSQISDELARYNENPSLSEQSVRRIASIVQMYLTENKLSYLSGTEQMQ